MQAFDRFDQVVAYAQFCQGGAILQGGKQSGQVVTLQGPAAIPAPLYVAQQVDQVVGGSEIRGAGI
jgi:hypothetical protein